MDKREKEEREKREKEINEQLKVEAKQIPDDPQVMKAYSLAIAQSAENNEPESPVYYDSESKTIENNGEASEAPAYDVKKQEEDNSLNGILSQYSHSKDSTAFGFSALLNLAQTSGTGRLPPDAQLIQEGESEAELLTEDALDDAISVAEVETGEPSPTNMAQTSDVQTVTDESQSSPIEIDAPADAPPAAAQQPQQASQEEAPAEAPQPAAAP